MTWVVVPAAGRGTRFGTELPKQYALVDGEPVLAHTLRALFEHPSIEGAMVVLAPDDADWPGWTSFALRPLLTCSGGDTRADSVLAGLNALPDSVRADDFVLVHDAARPNIALHDLVQLIERGSADPVGAILASPVRDTLKHGGDDGGIDGTQPREHLWRALTPQMFRRMQLTRALEAARASGVDVSDDAMAMELQGHRPLLVEGRDDNTKITTPLDLARFAFALAQGVAR